MEKKWDIYSLRVISSNGPLFDEISPIRIGCAGNEPPRGNEVKDCLSFPPDEFGFGANEPLLDNGVLSVTSSES